MLLISLLPLSVFAQTTIQESIMHDGKQRDYTLYFPASYDQNTEDYALIFSYHGFSSNGGQQRAYTAMDLVCDTANLIMCYPEGIDNAWNVGWSFGSTEDDVGFTSAMIDTFVSEYRINPRKIYACGMSNGGFFSYKLACELNDKIAAVASVTGSIVPGQDDVCMPNRAVPALQIHGTDDPIVPYNGAFGVAMPIEDVVQFWVNNNDCTSTPSVVDFPDNSTTDQSTASVSIYDDCAADTEVQFIRIENGEHTWPDALLDIGVTNRDFNASQYIWEFFSMFSLPQLSAVEEEDSHALLDVNVYPNPSSGTLRVDNLPSNSTIELYRIDGSFIQKRVSKSVLETFDLEAGFYILKVQNKNAIKQFFTIVQ